MATLHGRLLIAIIAMPHVLAALAQDHDSCRMCSDGSSIGIPDKVLKFTHDSLGNITCETLDLILPLIIPNSTVQECKDLQSIGSICGCPSKANSCSLCKDGAQMYAPEREVLWAPGLIDLDSPWLVPTCELVDAYLRTSEQEGGRFCVNAQIFLEEYCECPGTVGLIDDGNALSPDEQSSRQPCSTCTDGSAITKPGQDLGLKGLAFDDCAGLEVGAASLAMEGSELCRGVQSFSSLCGCPRHERSCDFCPDGTFAPYRDKLLYFGRTHFSGFAPTCKLWEAYTHSLDRDSHQCSVAHLSSSICGCAPALPNHCILHNNEPLREEYRDVELDTGLLSMAGLYPDDLTYPITCELAVEMQYQIPKRDRLCFLLQSRSDICGFNEGQNIYGGANNRHEQAVISWIPRVAGILSLIGALAIIVDVGTSRNKFSQIYNHIMASMSLFDIFSSIGWIVSTAASPTDDLWPIYGERGNEATCKTQGYLIQLALVTLMYNVSLFAYYYLSIVRRWRGERLSKMVKYLHVAPFAAVIVAFVGIPFYGSVLVTCHIATPPLADSWVPIAVLQVVPVVAALLVCTFIAILLCCRIGKQRGITQRARSVSIIRRIERMAIGQALSYLVAMHISWVSMLVFIWQNSSEPSFYVICTTLFFIPIQGALNSVNYFCPRIVRLLRQKQLMQLIQTRRKNKEPAKEPQLNPDSPLSVYPVVEEPANSHQFEDVSSLGHHQSRTCPGTAVQSQIVEDPSVLLQYDNFERNELSSAEGPVMESIIEEEIDDRGG